MQSHFVLLHGVIWAIGLLSRTLNEICISNNLSTKLRQSTILRRKYLIKRTTTIIYIKIRFNSFFRFWQFMTVFFTQTLKVTKEAEHFCNICLILSFYDKGKLYHQLRKKMHFAKFWIRALKFTFVKVNAYLQFHLGRKSLFKFWRVFEFSI